MNTPSQLSTDPHNHSHTPKPHTPDPRNPPTTRPLADDMPGTLFSRGLTTGSIPRVSNASKTPPESYAPSRRHLAILLRFTASSRRTGKTLTSCMSFVDISMATTSLDSVSTAKCSFTYLFFFLCLRSTQPPARFTLTPVESIAMDMGSCSSFSA
jgi:hypothetical protein